MQRKIKWFKIPPLGLLLGLYFILSLSLLFGWVHQDRNRIAGDERPYLLMAYGLTHYHQLEQTQIYCDYFKKNITDFTSDHPVDTQPTPKNSHTIQGPHGLFSVHGVGLPLLLSLPFLWGKSIGANLFMVLLNSLIIVTAWKITRLFKETLKARLIAVIAACFGLPLLPASNQIFPDLTAGMIAFAGVYWFMTLENNRCFLKEVLICCALAFLPWLHIKFLLIMGILIFFLIGKTLSQKNKKPRICVMLIITFLSLTILAFYNHYAFGKITGPYEGGLVINKESLMVFMGLFLDQNQGFIFQNPISLLGILSFFCFYLRHKIGATLIFLLCFSMLALNASHINWYGGHSFSGRFEWTSVIIFMPITLFGVIQLITYHQRLRVFLISLLTLWQAFLFYRYGFQGLILYTRELGTPLAKYSLFFGKIYNAMPALYDVQWAYHFWPNYIWGIGILFVFFIGFLNRKNYAQ